MALIKCKECGHECSEHANSCPNCGYPLNGINHSKSEHPVKRCVQINYNGVFALFDSKIQVTINGIPIGYFSAKKGFFINHEIEGRILHIKLKHGLYSSHKSFSINPNKDYFCKISYDRLWGGFNIHLLDIDGVEIIPL